MTVHWRGWLHSMIEEGLWTLLFLLEEGENKLAGPYPLSAIVPLWTGCCCIAQSCLTLCDPTDCSPPGSSVHGILQARTLEWVSIPFSRGSSWPRDQTGVSCIGRWILYHLSHQGNKSRNSSCATYRCRIQKSSRKDHSLLWIKIPPVHGASWVVQW